MGKNDKTQNFQKSAKNPILVRYCWAAYQNFQEQDLSEKQGQISVAIIFKFARFIMANLKIVATLI